MKNKNESGRSLLEMLMVLGIMGIITYGAISGISFGVDMYKANATYMELEEMAAAIKDLYSWKWPPDVKNGGDDICDAFCENDVGKRCAEGDHLVPVPAGSVKVILSQATCEKICNDASGESDVVILSFNPTGTEATKKFIIGQLEAKNYENLECCKQCTTANKDFRCIIRDY